MLQIAADMAKVLEQTISVSNEALEVTIQVDWVSDYEGAGACYDYAPPYDPNEEVSTYSLEEIVNYFPSMQTGWKIDDKDKIAKFKKEVNRLKRLCNSL